MKSKLVLLLLFSSVLTLTSCTLVKEKVYPFVDEAAVRWDNERVNSYVLLSKDSTVTVPGLDGGVTIDATPHGLRRKNLEFHSAIEKPKVNFQTKHEEWITSVDGHKCMYWLFYAMVAVCVIGFLLPFLLVVIRSKCDKASPWFNNLLPIVVVLLTIMEAIYLFIFNYTIPPLSPTIYGFWRWVLNMLCMVVILLTQTFCSALYAEHLAMKNESNSKVWGGYVRWSWILALVGAFFYRYVGFFLQMIALVVGVITFLFTLVRNRKEKTAAARIHTVTMLAFPWVFVYFLSYSLLLVFVVLLGCIGLLFILKGIGMGASFSSEQAAITERYNRHPEKYANRSDAEREYYAEKAKKAERKAKAKK